MLKRLQIQNYAIIDEIEIDFDRRLNIITGETGAGKSILMGALSLILGQRADSTALLNREKKCVVEGFFSVTGQKQISDFLKENDLDAEDELVIRREIAVSGKSRAFVNDTLVTLQQLQLLSSSLVDLHQQFDTLSLGDSDFQRKVVDALAVNGNLLQQYQSKFYQLTIIQKELEEWKNKKNQFAREYDYNKFLFDELEEADFKQNELEDAEGALKLLSNTESIKNALQRVNEELMEGEQPVVQQLKSLSNHLNNFASYHPQLPLLAQRLQSVQIELADISGEIDLLNSQVQYHPERVRQLNERISQGYKLLKKHNLKNTDELLQLKTALEEKLRAVLNIDDALMVKERELDAVASEASVLASRLSVARKKQLKPLEEQVNILLKQVGMPNARLKVSWQEADLLNEWGKDIIEFLFDANLPTGQTGKNNKFEPIRKVASGGELSRLMLCIKSLVVKSLDLPTLIFDEIDSGISGEAARQVGVIMKEIATERQVICITHQPQIAGKASVHFFVYKEIKGGAIKTNIRALTTEERITTIAQMLSGERPTTAALANAKEMVMN
jgi:DNA repair protein RecN (Recombination protein N)